MIIDCEDIISIDELIDLLGISRNTAYKLLNSGYIKGFMLANKWRIPRAAIEEFIIQRCR